MKVEGEGVIPAATIAGIALASALVPLNSTMIAVALPEIASDFDISTRQASVLITLYLVAMLVGQPMSGRVCDAFGARRVAVIATTGFGIFSAAAMVASSFWLLVALRAMQAAFASALIPSVQAMLRELVPAVQRGRAFGVQGSVIGAGAGLGPVIGGLAMAAFGWRAIFGVNLPLVVAVLVVLHRRVPMLPGASEDEAPVAPGGSEPLFNRVFSAAFATQALSNVALYGLLLAVPIVLDSRGWSAAGTGLCLSFLTIGMVVMGPYGGRLGDRLGRRRPVVLGLTVGLVAVAASAIGGDDVSSALLVGTLLLFGLGQGVANPSVMTAGIEAAPPKRVGSAAGVLSSSRYIGSIASTLVLAGVVTDDGDGLVTLLIVCTAAMAVSLAVARSLPGRAVVSAVSPELSSASGEVP
jgi:MFS family permease